MPFIAIFFNFFFLAILFIFLVTPAAGSGLSAPAGSPSLCCEVVTLSLDPIEGELDLLNVKDWMGRWMQTSLHFHSSEHPTTWKMKADNYLFGADSSSMIEGPRRGIGHLVRLLRDFPV